MFFYFFFYEKMSVTNRAYCIDKKDINARDSNWRFHAVAKLYHGYKPMMNKITIIIN